MGLRDEILRLPFDARFNYDGEHNILFLNLSELVVSRRTSSTGSRRGSEPSSSLLGTKFMLW